MPTFAQWTAKLLQLLHIIRHTKYVSTDRIALWLLHISRHTKHMSTNKTALWLLYIARHTKHVSTDKTVIFRDGFSQYVFYFFVYEKNSQVYEKTFL